MKRLQYILYFIVISIFAFSLTRGNTDKNNKTEGENLKDIKPCELLTSEQVTTVLPGHDEGYVAKDGGSLIEGVDSYQCSYSNDNYDLFTVTIHVATNKKQFKEIKPNPSTIRMIHKHVLELNIGDGGWLYGDPDDLKLKAIKGYTVIELELTSENAEKKGDALVEIVSILIEKIK